MIRVATIVASMAVRIFAHLSCAAVTVRKKGDEADWIDDDKINAEGGQEILNHGVCPVYG